MGNFVVFRFLFFFLVNCICVTIFAIFKMAVFGTKYASGEWTRLVWVTVVTGSRLTGFDFLDPLGEISSWYLKKFLANKNVSRERLFLGFLKEDLFYFFLENNFLRIFCFRYTLIMYAIRPGPVNYDWVRSTNCQCMIM